MAYKDKAQGASVSQFKRDQKCDLVYAGKKTLPQANLVLRVLAILDTNTILSQLNICMAW